MDQKLSLQYRVAVDISKVGLVSPELEQRMEVAAQRAAQAVVDGFVAGLATVSPAGEAKSETVRIQESM